MAHNINFNEATGKHSFFSVKEIAWHGLGQIVQDYPSSFEALQYAGLDFQVAKAPNRQIFPSGKTEVSANSFFTYRTDTEIVLGDKVGKDYQIVQNIDAFSFFDAIVGDGTGIKYETAGALGDGERIFITAKLPDYIRVGNSNDIVEKYLFLTTSHDGSGSIIAAFTPVRIVCANTLAAAMNNKEMAVRLRHTVNVKERLSQAHKIMGMSIKQTSELQDKFTQWAKVRITDKEVLKLIQMAMSPDKETLDKVNAGLFAETSTNFKNTCNEVFSYGMQAESQQLETTKGTLFGAYNAITGFYQNVESYSDNEAKMKSIFYGGTAQTRTQKAFNLCDAFSEYGESALLLS